MRGGLRKKVKLKTGQSALLEAIWKMKGGVAAVAHTLDTHLQVPLNWKLRGKVPLTSCGEASRKLGISLFALNYLEYADLNNAKNIPSWESVVKSFNFPKEVTEYIMSFKGP